MISLISEADLNHGILNLENITQAEYDEDLDRHIAGKYVWQRSDFVHYLSSKDHRCRKVSDNRGKITGFTIYEIMRSRINILRLAYTIESAADELLTYIKTDKLVAGRVVITMYVNELNLPLQLYLRSKQFKCVKVEDDLYLFEQKLSLTTKSAA